MKTRDMTWAVGQLGGLESAHIKNVCEGRAGILFGGVWLVKGKT